MSDTNDPLEIPTPSTHDVTADPKPSEPERQTTVIQRRAGLPALVGGIIAAAVGFGAAQFVPDGWPMQSTAALSAELAAMKTDLATLQSRFAELPLPDPTITDRLAALEKDPAIDVASLEGRITMLEAAPAPLTMTQGSGINVATSVLSAQAKDIAGLKADVAALQAGGPISPNIEARLAEAEARAVALAEQTEAATTESRLRTALDRLEIARETGSPYASLLADLGEVPVAAVLRDNAANGLPSLPALQDSFPGFARMGLEASLRVTAGDTWTDRAASFLRSQTGARSLTPREGNDPDAVLSRVDAAVAEGRIADAVAETAALPPEGQTAMAGWLAQATVYLTAQQAIVDLRSALKVE